MNLFLTKNRILKGDSSLIGYCRENKCECLNIQVMDQSLWTKQAYLEFQVNEGEKYTTEALDMSSGVISYKVPNGLLIEKGKLKMQVVIRDGEVVQKSSIKEFTINEAICAGDDVVIEYPTGGGSSSVVDLSEYEDGDTLPQEIVNKLLKENTLVLYKMSSDSSDKILLTYRTVYQNLITYKYSYVDTEDNSLRDCYLDIDKNTNKLGFYDNYREYVSLAWYNDEKENTQKELNSKLEIVDLSGYEDGDTLPKETITKLNRLGFNGAVRIMTPMGSYIATCLGVGTNLYYGFVLPAKIVYDLNPSRIQSFLIEINVGREIINFKYTTSDLEDLTKVYYISPKIENSYFEKGVFDEERQEYTFDLTKNGIYIVQDIFKRDLTNQNTSFYLNFGLSKNINSVGKLCNSVQVARDYFGDSNAVGWCFGNKASSYFVFKALDDVSHLFLTIKVTDDEVFFYRIDEV